MYNHILDVTKQILNNLIDLCVDCLSNIYRKTSRKDFTLCFNFTYASFLFLNRKWNESYLDLPSSAQKELKLPGHALKTECPTRWGSWQAMIERFLEQQRAISHFLPDVLEDINKASHTEYVSISFVKPGLYLFSNSTHDYLFSNSTILENRYLYILATGSPSERIFIMWGNNFAQS